MTFSMLTGAWVMVREIDARFLDTSPGGGWHKRYDWGELPQGFTWGRRYRVLCHDMEDVILCDDSGSLQKLSRRAVAFPPQRIETDHEDVREE